MKLSQSQLEALLSNAYLDHRGKNLYADCPACGEHEFGISLENNHPFNCFRKKQCGFQGNIYTLLKKLGRAREFLTDREINVYEKLENGLDVGKIEIDLTMEEIEKPLLWKRVKQDPYLESRGFTPQQFEKFEVGRSILNKEYVTFLVRREGKLVGYVSRSERDKKWIDQYNKNNKDHYLRYKNSSTDFGKTLFGIDEVIEGVTTDVILVEGIFSKTKTDSNLELDNLDSIKCCATFGAKLSIHQIELLKQKQVKNIWLWFEADVLDTVKEIATYASLFFNVRVSYLDGHDPGDCDVEEALALMENASDYLNFEMNYVKSNLKI